MALDYLTEFLMREVWADVEDFQGYQVSTHGRVRRLKKGGYYVMSPTLGGGAPMYWTVNLYKDGKAYKRRVHRLMGFAFIPNDNPEINTTIDHLNGNPHDNRLENLAWKSQKRNNHNRGCVTYKHEGRYLYELMIERLGENYTDDDYTVIRNRLDQGFSFENALKYLEVFKENPILAGRSRRVIFRGSTTTILLLHREYGIDYWPNRFMFEPWEDVTEYFENLESGSLL